MRLLDNPVFQLVFVNFFSFRGNSGETVWLADGTFRKQASQSGMEGGRDTVVFSTHSFPPYTVFSIVLKW